MSSPANRESAEAIENANQWAGKQVRIRGRGGWIVATERAHNVVVTTSVVYSNETLQDFLIESIQAPDDLHGVVVFRAEGTDLYLTNIMYGDKPRQELCSALAFVPQLLADNVGLIMDYAVGRPTDASNFEGAGFNYSPMMLQRGPPSKLQMFQIVGQVGFNKGIKSLFGTYWRSQWWQYTVSQSPHMLGDETWSFEVVSDSESEEEDASFFESESDMDDASSFDKSDMDDASSVDIDIDYLFEIEMNHRPATSLAS
jgi:hypothetical protein